MHQTSAIDDADSDTPPAVDKFAANCPSKLYNVSESCGLSIYYRALTSPFEVYFRIFNNCLILVSFLLPNSYQYAAVVLLLHT